MSPRRDSVVSTRWVQIQVGARDSCAVANGPNLDAHRRRTAVQLALLGGLSRSEDSKHDGDSSNPGIE